MDLTYPERVTLYNMPRLKKMVANGPTQWPGANHCIITAPNGARLKQDLRWRKEEIADNLKTGDVVLRHLIDGDAVLFNRPTDTDTGPITERLVTCIACIAGE